MSCPSDSCNQGRLQCPTPGYCHHDQAERLSAAMNQPITREGGMQVSFDPDEPLCEPLAIELFAVLAAVAFTAVFGYALLWAIYQLWPILVAYIAI